MGGNLSRSTVFALGIMPYISASIFAQIAGAVIPSVEKMQKDEEGRKKITQYTRYATVGLAMVQACFGGIPRIEVNPIEIDRGGLSFMVDTVESLRQRWPSATLLLLVGDDVVSTLPRWRDVTRLLAVVQLVVLHRANRGHDVAGLTVPLESIGASTARRLATRRVDMSSTEIRARVRDGRSIRGFVPDSVATYIATTGLYLENSRESSTTEGPARA